MFELLNFNLGLLQFGTGRLVFLAATTPILQAGFPHLFKAKRPGTHLLVTHLVFQCHLAVVLPTSYAFPDNLDTLLQRGFSSLLHVASSS